MKFKSFDTVKILTGKFTGLVGSVIEARDQTEMVKVEIQGTLNDVPIDEKPWLKYSQVEAV